MGQIQKVVLNFHQVHVVFWVTTFYTRKKIVSVSCQILMLVVHYLKPVLCLTKFCFQTFSHASTCVCCEVLNWILSELNNLFP